MEQKKTKSKKGFASDPKRASEIAKATKSKQSPEDRTRRARLAAQAKWEKYKRDNLNYEDIDTSFAGDKQ